MRRFLRVPSHYQVFAMVPLVSAFGGCIAPSPRIVGDTLAQVPVPVPVDRLPEACSLDTKGVTQQARFWCWAACTEMVIKTLDPESVISQCQQANDKFNRSDCCPPLRDSPCDKRGWPDFQRYGFESKQTDSKQLSWDLIRIEIATHKRPVIFTKKYDGGGGHMMVVVGYIEEGSDRRLRVLDPDPARSGEPREISYEAYVKGVGYSHWNDYYEIRKKASR